MIISNEHRILDVFYLKELLSELIVHDLVRRILFGQRGEQAAEDGVDAALLHQSPRAAWFKF